MLHLHQYGNLVDQEARVPMQKILVVDDNVSYLDEIECLLKDAGYLVQTCPDPLRVAHALKSDRFQCVLLDYHMPGLDGEDVLHLIHSAYPEIPVIICSGYTDFKDSYLLKEGAQDILRKPFDHQVLFDTLARVVTGEESITQISVKGYDLREARETVIRKLVVKALGRSEFNVTHAAKLLGISRQCLLRYMKRYGIQHH